MRATITLFRTQPAARVFFAALAQSALGTGAAYVALLLIAYQRFHSPWGISLILIADLVPAMALGPVLGALADRFSRRACIVTSDLIRAIGCLGVAVVPSFEGALGFALLIGLGTGMFTPAALAALPSLVEDRLRPAATSVYGAITDAGFTVGPGIAALMLVFTDAEGIMIFNGITFLLSAAVLWRLSFGRRPELAGAGPERATPGTLFTQAREGVRTVSALGSLRLVLLATATMLFWGAVFNVGELPFVSGGLSAGKTAFGVLVALNGLGFIVGSILGAGGGSTRRLLRHWLEGMLIMGVGLLATGLAPTVGLAALTFGVIGLGNGLMLVYERLLIQASVPDELAGRVFGVKDSLTAWAFAAAFVAGGGLVDGLDPAGAIAVAGLGGIAAWLIAALVLRRRLVADEGAAAVVSPPPGALLDGGPYVARDRASSQQRT